MWSRSEKLLVTNPATETLVGINQYVALLAYQMLLSLNFNSRMSTRIVPELMWGLSSHYAQSIKILVF